MPRDVRGIGIDVRHIKIAAAQMGPNNEGTSREEIVERMLGLLAEAVREGVELIAYPEMALTTYFPKKIRPDFDQFFETEVAPKALEPLVRRAAEARIAVHVGFCEKAGGKYFNTALLTDRDGRLCGTFRKIHLPATKPPDGFAQVFEPYYSAHGDTNGDELVVARIDLDQMLPIRKRWNFLGRRQPQHYGRLLQPVTEKEPYRCPFPPWTSSSAAAGSSPARTSSRRPSPSRAT